MGMYLGQLPPADVARFKAELAETIMSNFCYPRFFDYRTGSLRMRPIDRAKRQEVWAYLSSVDFTTWNRVDLTGPELHRQIERLFIHYVQRNRCFFGKQGRKRISDIRMLITLSATSVVDALRGHLTGQRQGRPLLGTPHAPIPWSQGSGRSEPNWEQVMASTMMLQQQLQGRVTSSNGTANRTTQRTDHLPVVRKPVPVKPTEPVVKPAATQPVVRPVPTQPVVARPAATQPTQPVVARPATIQPTQPVVARPATIQPTQPIVRPVPTQPVLKPVPSKEVHILQTTEVILSGETSKMLVGEEDIAIFEQMRHQLMLWLRLEAVRADLNIADQGPAQLLELLRRQNRFEETRLQVVSTLLDLANQVIKDGKVSLLDYKQALIFHLMHTR